MKIPYFAILVFMIGTTFYQQRQMTKASPAGAQSSQQQAILKIMPVMFGIFGFTFPAGLVVYWTTSNLWQIGQQAALLRAGHIGPDALERRKQEIANKPPKTKGGMFSGFMTRAEEERKRREAGGGGKRGGTSGRPAAKGGGTSGTGKGGGGSRGGRSSAGDGSRGVSGKGGAKGTPAKGTPPKGTPAKGTPPKGVPPGGDAPRSKGGATPPQRPKPKRPGGGETGGS